MKKQLIIVLLSIFLIVSVTTAQQPNRQLRQQALDRAYAASIRAFGVDTATNRQNSAQFSAVVVSEEGHILTVAHAIRPGAFYKVTFPDGQEAIAQGFGRLVTDQKTTRPDVAMMKIITPGSWPFAEMGWSGVLQEGQFCFGISYPESQRLLTPMLRVGRILQPLDQWGFVVSSCIMETGDSGGPLFDEWGRVISLHSRIDAPEGSNFEVPIDTYRKYWDALCEVVNYEVNPTQSSAVGDDPKQDFVKPTPRPLSKPIPNCAAVISIESKSDEDSIQYIKGTVFTTALPMKDNRTGQFLLSKSSELLNDPVAITATGQRIPLRVFHRDRATDLVFLYPDKPLAHGLAFDALGKRKFSFSELGQDLFSPVDSLTKLSVIGTQLVDLPLRFNAGDLGATVRDAEGKVLVSRVSPNGSAALVGLVEGDHIVSINRYDISGLASFQQVMSRYFAGEVLQLVFMRGGEAKTTELTLRQRRDRPSNHPADRIPGGKSMRRDGFEGVFLHDARIHAPECGGPVFDSDGNLMGINIARFSHTTTVALPTSIIKQLVSATLK